MRCTLTGAQDDGCATLVFKLCVPYRTYIPWSVQYNLPVSVACSENGPLDSAVRCTW